MNIATKRSKTIVGAILILLGVSISALATYTALNPIKPVNTDQVKAKLISECKKQIELFEIDSTNKNGMIEINKFGLEGWESDLAKFSIIASNCNGFKIDMFCMGNNCKSKSGLSITGTSMTLTYTGQQLNIAR